MKLQNLPETLPLYRDISNMCSLRKKEKLSEVAYGATLYFPASKEVHNKQTQYIVIEERLWCKK